jgi:hypothetical protein
LDQTQADRAARVSRRTRQSRESGVGRVSTGSRSSILGHPGGIFLGPVPQVIGNDPKNLMGNSKAPTRSACCELVEDRLTRAALNRKEMMLTLSSLIVY